MDNKDSILSQKISYYQTKLLPNIIIKMLTKRAKKGKMLTKAIKNPKRLERKNKLIINIFIFKNF